MTTTDHVLGWIRCDSQPRFHDQERALDPPSNARAEPNSSEPRPARRWGHSFRAVRAFRLGRDTGAVEIPNQSAPA